MSGAALDPVAPLIARAALSLLFAQAAVHKLRDVGAFRAAITGYAIVPPLWTVPAGAMLIAAEVGVAAGQWLPGVHTAAAFAAAALLLLYAAAMTVNLVRGRRDVDCGCAGPARSRPISALLVARNGALAAVAIIAALPAGSRALVWVDGITVAAGVCAVAALYAAADGLLAARPFGEVADD